MIKYFGNLKKYYIYNIAIVILLSVVFVDPTNSNIVFPWIFIVNYPISFLEIFIAGPVFGYLIQINHHISFKTTIIYGVIIFFFTYITFCIPLIPYTSISDFLLLQWIFPLKYAFSKSILFVLFGVITKILYNRIFNIKTLF